MVRKIIIKHIFNIQVKLLKSILHIPKNVDGQKIVRAVRASTEHFARHRPLL